MATSTNLGALLRHYANRQRSAFVNLREFSDYLKKYSARHLEEQPDLVQYVEIPESTLLKELEDYQSRHEAFIISSPSGKTTVVCLTYYSVYFANKYKDIISNPQVPFPSISDLPKNLPTEANHSCPPRPLSPSETKAKGDLEQAEQSSPTAGPSPSCPVHSMLRSGTAYGCRVTIRLWDPAVLSVEPFNPGCHQMGPGGGVGDPEDDQHVRTGPHLLLGSSGPGTRLRRLPEPQTEPSPGSRERGPC